MIASSAVNQRIVLAAWAIGLGFAAFLIVNDVVTYQHSRDISINGSAIWGRDFVNVWSAGRLVLEERTDILYDVDAYRRWQDATFGWGINDHNYSYPPLTLIYAPLFGALPYFVALAVWLTGSLAVFFLVARPWLKDCALQPALALALPSTLICIWAGHYGLLLGALWLGAWRLLDNNPRAAGVLIGMMAVKPHLAVLLPLVLIRRGAWHTIAAAALTAGALVALSCMLFGTALWQTYLDQTAAEQLRMVAATHTFFIKMMPTVTPALFAYGVTPPVAAIIQGAVALTAAGALIIRLPRNAADAGQATAVATFLVLPYGFNYDMTVVGLAALIAMSRTSAAGQTWSLFAAAGVFILPAVLIFTNKMGLWIAPLILAAFLATLLRERAATE